MKTNLVHQQRIIRELSPAYLAQEVGKNPALSVVLDTFQKQLIPTKREPKAVVTDIKENPARCFDCYGSDDSCTTCLGIGDMPDLPCVDMTVYRGFDEIPVQVSFNRAGENILDSWVLADVGRSTTRPPIWAEGTSIMLTQEECELAKDALRAEKEAHKAGEGLDTEHP